MGEISLGGHPDPDTKPGFQYRIGASGSGLEDGLDASGLGW